MKFDFKVTGFAQINKAIRSMGKTAKDPETVMRRIGVWMIKSTTRTFETEGKRLGSKWTELRPSTMRQRAGLAGGARILDRTGTLKRSITFEVPKPHSVRWGHGTTAPYGKWHVTGTARMVERNFLGISDEDRVMLPRIAGRELADKLLAGIRLGSI